MSRTQHKLSESLLSDLGNYVDISAPSWGPDSSSFEVACYRLRDSLLKKFNNDPDPTDDACKAALEKFLAVNARCRSWELKINYEYQAEILGLLKQELYDFWHGSDDEGPVVYDYGDLYRSGGVGPGASVGARGTDFYSKFYSKPHSCTSRVADVWQILINKRSAVFFDDDQESVDVSIVNHSVLSFVNKNVDIARTICTEPLGNMWLQLGLGRLIEKRLASQFGIRMDTQPDVNRALALRASLDDSLATIDLESASDSLANRMLEQVLPRGMYHILQFLRSPSCLLPDKQLCPLEMVSTMGNGFTFPLQTLLFSSVVRAVYRFLGIAPLSRGATTNRNWAVFGDDIICLSGQPVRLVTNILAMLGFKVNDAKSYVEGPFRESCGVDGHLGVNVRPVYVKHLRSLQDHFVAVNRLAAWCSEWGALLPCTFRYLLSKMRSNPRHSVSDTVIRYAVPLDLPLDAGLLVPLSCCSPRSVAGVPGLRRYTRSVPVRKGWRVEGAAFAGPDCPLRFSPRGLELAFIGGYLRGQKCTVRQRETSYVTKREVTPNWDYSSLPQPPFVPFWGRERVTRLVSVWTGITSPSLL